MGNAYKLLVGKLEGKKHRCNRKIILEQILEKKDSALWN
jgi:hypothetical protein